MSNEEESISIEETNALRAKLGLKPLTLTPVPAKESEKTPDETSQIPSEDIVQRIAKSRNKRKYLSKTISESADTTESTGEWLKKVSRRRTHLSEQKPQKSESATYTKEELSGIRIRHDEDEIIAGDNLIFTLQDSKLLDNDEDVLENVHLKDAWRTNKNIEKRSLNPQTKYNPYDDDVNEKNEILAHYDSDEEEKLGGKVGFRLNEHVQKELEKVKSVMNYTVEDSSESFRLGSDYLTREEMEKTTFKKSKKQSKKRSKRTKKRPPQSVLKDLKPIEVEKEADHRSRNVREKTFTASSLSRAEKYSIAKQKAESHSAMLVDRRQVFDDEVIDRPLPTFVTGGGGMDVLKAMEESNKIKEELRAQHRATLSVIDFTDTSEFLESVELPVKKEEVEEVVKEEEGVKDESDGMDMDMDIESDEEKESPVESAEPEEEADEALEFMHEEADDDRFGVAAILRILRSRGIVGEGNKQYVCVSDGCLTLRGKSAVEEDEIEIVRTNEFGQVAHPKDVFRQMSYRFHNQMPSVGKKEKSRKKYKQEMKLKKRGNVTKKSKGLLQKLQSTAKGKGNAFLVLDARGGGMFGQGPATKKKDIGAPDVQ